MASWRTYESVTEPDKTPEGDTLVWNLRCDGKVHVAHLDDEFYDKTLGHDFSEELAKVDLSACDKTCGTTSLSPR